MSKYHSKKVTVDGITFDSKKEANRYCELRLLERVGEISDLKRQVKFTLIPAQVQNGKVIERKCSYTADFVYREKDKTIVEDVKGYRTPEYKIKRKLMLHVHGIKIREV
jgi:hypothetical protein|nr:MAG TPA: Endonuclease [Caudoviricetes sp.]